MLEQMRKGAQNPAVKVMFFLLAGMFVVWGVGDVFRNNSGTGYIATVGKSGVTGAELDNVVKMEVARYQQMTGKTLTAEEIEQTGVKKYALGQLIRDKVTTMRAADLNLTGGNKDVSKHIDGNKIFFDEQGNFDKARFKEVLQANGFTEERFVTAIKKEAAVNNLMESIAATGVSTDVIAKAIFTYRNEKRVADILTVPANAVTEIADPLDTDLVQFYQERQDNFAVPEQRAVSYITFNADKVKSGISLSDEELKAVYQNNIGQFKTEEARDVTQYLFTTQEEANAAFDKISKGDVKGFASNKVELGKLTKSSVPAEVKNAIFALKAKEVSNPAKSELGWHVFVLNAIEAEKVKPFDEVKKDISKDLLEKKASDEFSKYGNQVEDEFAAGKTMEDVAKSFDLVVHKVPSVNDKGMNDAGGKVTDIPDLSVSLPIIFGLDKGAPSALTLLSDNSTYVIFRADSVTPKRVKALDEVKGLAIKAWKDAQKGKLLKEKAAAIATKLKSGEDYKDIISKMNLKLESSKTVTRHSDEQGAKALPTELTNEIFNLKKEGGFTGAYPVADGGFAIARLVKITGTKPENDKAGYKTVKTQLEDEMRDDILAQYTNFLRNKYPVYIKSDVFGGEKQ